MRKFISVLKQVRNEYFYLLKGLKNCRLPCIIYCVCISNYFDSQLRCVRLGRRKPRSDSHVKRPFHAFVKKVRCVTRKEKLFQTRRRRLQHFSLSLPSVPSFLNRVRHLTLAKNSSFGPLGAQHLSYTLKMESKLHFDNIFGRSRVYVYIGKLHFS